MMCGFPPPFAPNDSHDLIDALRVVDPVKGTELPSDVNNWHHFARLLEPRFGQRQSAFNQENFADTKRKFALVARQNLSRDQRRGGSW
jgi:hypothetical protein